MNSQNPPQSSLEQRLALAEQRIEALERLVENLAAAPKTKPKSSRTKAEHPCTAQGSIQRFLLTFPKEKVVEMFGILPGMLVAEFFRMYRDWYKDTQGKEVRLNSNSFGRALTSTGIFSRYVRGGVTRILLSDDWATAMRQSYKAIVDHDNAFRSAT